MRTKKKHKSTTLYNKNICAWNKIKTTESAKKNLEKKQKREPTTAEHKKVAKWNKNSDVGFVTSIFAIFIYCTIVLCVSVLFLTM